MRTLRRGRADRHLHGARIKLGFDRRSTTCRRVWVSDSFRCNAGLSNAPSTWEVAALDAAIKYVLEPQGLSLASGKWLTALGGELYEFRIRHSVSEIERMYGRHYRRTAPGKAGGGVAQAVRPLLRPADHLVAARL